MEELALIFANALPFAKFAKLGYLKSRHLQS